MNTPKPPTPFSSLSKDEQAKLNRRYKRFKNKVFKAADGKPVNLHKLQEDFCKQENIQL